jgi:hypothetical protein
LFGTTGGSVSRTCTIPFGTALFIPIINQAVDTTPPPFPVEQLQETAQLIIDNVTGNCNGIKIDNWFQRLHSLWIVTQSTPTTLDLMVPFFPSL